MDEIPSFFIAPLSGEMYPDKSFAKVLFPLPIFPVMIYNPLLKRQSATSLKFSLEYKTFSQFSSRDTTSF